MAKLPPMSRDADRIFQALNEGRHADAIKHAVQKLRAGEANPVFLNAVAFLLEAKPPRGRGRPRKAAPAHWYDIGQSYENSLYDGVPSSEVLQELAKEFGQSERNIQRAVAFYRDARDEARAVEADMLSTLDDK